MTYEHEYIETTNQEICEGCKYVFLGRDKTDCDRVEIVLILEDLSDEFRIAFRIRNVDSGKQPTRHRDQVRAKNQFRRRI